MKKWLSVLLVLVLAFSMIACEKNNSTSNNGNEKAVEFETIAPKSILQVEENRPVVSIVLEDYGTITLELYPEIAPNTVNNFIDLIQQEFYNGLKFHRVIDGFMIQGGDPIGNGTGGPGYSIDAEFVKENDEFVTYLSHKRGVLSMARSQDVNSAGSQFFIVHQDSPALDQKYTAFGKVIDNIEAVDGITTVETGEYDNPLEDVIITKIEVNLNGYSFTKPVINE